MSSGKEIKTRAEISKIESRKSVEKINKTNIYFFEKIKKTDETLVNLIKKKKEDANY